MAAGSGTSLVSSLVWMACLNIAWDIPRGALWVCCNALWARVTGRNSNQCFRGETPDMRIVQGDCETVWIHWWRWQQCAVYVEDQTVQGFSQLAVIYRCYVCSLIEMLIMKPRTYTCISAIKHNKKIVMVMTMVVLHVVVMTTFGSVSDDKVVITITYTYIAVYNNWICQSWKLSMATLTEQSSSRWPVLFEFPVLCKNGRASSSVTKHQLCGLVLLKQSNRTWYCIHNWPNSQIPECTCSISHNALFRTEMCTFLFWMEHYGIWNRCILGFVLESLN